MRLLLKSMRQFKINPFKNLSLSSLHVGQNVLPAKASRAVSIKKEERIVGRRWWYASVYSVIQFLTLSNFPRNRFFAKGRLVRGFFAVAVAGTWLSDLPLPLPTWSTVCKLSDTVDRLLTTPPWCTPPAFLVSCRIWRVRCLEYMATGCFQALLSPWSARSKVRDLLTWKPRKYVLNCKSIIFGVECYGYLFQF